MTADRAMMASAADFMRKSIDHRYSYNFSWLGVPIIQYPQDIVALQELVWSDRPDLIVETGVAHGGSAVFFASMLELLGGGTVVAIDIDIRPHNRAVIEAHPLAKRIVLMEGSSTDAAVVEAVAERARSARSVLVVLDSNHTHEHVARELDLYSAFVKRGGHLAVLDTIVEHLPGPFAGRPWGPGNSPGSAVAAFLRTNRRFVTDNGLSDKLLITVAPGGYLRCVKD
ncbi:MAG TPA: CmcI family methyltransferase [Gemmatimonadaceae bacterium]|nr:CmcI family methyltransferase [Gemmatimonadaceae bacterium]